MKLCILILQYNSADLTLQLLESLVKHEGQNLNNYRVVVMDNNSDNSMANLIRDTFKFVEFITYPENYGFAVAHNKYFDQVREEWVLLLNNDCILINDAVTRTLSLADKVGADFATCALFNEDGSPQTNFSTLPSPLRRLLLHYTGINRLVIEPWRRLSSKSRVGYINGAFLLFYKASIPGTTLFHDDYFMYGEDLDLMIRLGKCRRKGYRLSSGKVIHLGGASAKRKWEDGAQGKLKEERTIDCFGRYYPAWQVKLFTAAAKIKKDILYAVKRHANDY